MTPLALTLGLMPLDPSERSRVPEVDIASGLVPAGHVYVGAGHHSTRIQRTKCSPPFTPGHDCRPDEFLPRYLHFVCDSLIDDLSELIGQILVYDTSPSMPSAADVLAGLVFAMLASDPHLRQPLPRKRGSGPPARRSKAVPKALGLAMAPLADGLPRVSPTRPPHLFRRWLQSNDLDPIAAPATARLAQRTAEGQQAGAVVSAASELYVSSSAGGSRSHCTCATTSQAY